MAESLLQELDVADVELRAQSSLATSSIYALREIRVEREGDSLLLIGRVKSFYEKQMAQEIVRAAAAGLNVVNRIEVD